MFIMNKTELRDGGAIPRPCLFDVCLYVFTFLCPIFFLLPWHLNMAQGMFFVFGVLFLLGISFLCEKQREVKNRWLGGIILWSLAGVFIHTFRFGLNQTYAAGFINFCLMSEGFIYVLCGCLLYYLVVSYSKKFNIAYPLLVINILNLFFALTQTFGVYLIWHNINQGNQMNVAGMLGTKSQLAVFSAISIPVLFHFRKCLAVIPITTLILSGSYTAVVALFLGTTLFLFLNRHFELAFIWVVLGMTFLPIVVDWNKFYIRPPAWAYTLKEIKQSPIIGHGFDNTLAGNKIFVSGNFQTQYVYRHNDYLNVARDLGVPFLLMILMAIIGVMARVKFDYLWLSLVILMIACFAQTSFYWPRIAGVGLIMFGLKGRELYV